MANIKTESLENVQAKLQRLERLFEDIQHGRLSDELLNECPEISTILADIEKCKYRKEIMKRHIAEISGNSGKKPANTSGKQNGVTMKPKAPKPNIKYVKVLNYNDSLLEGLTAHVEKSVKEIFPEVNVKINMRETSKLEFGDYQVDMSHQISKGLEGHGIKLSPDQVAQKIADSLPKLDIVDKYEHVRSFVNIFLNRKLVGKKIASIFKDGISIPEVEKKRVVIDFSSPNIAKQMHVGHLRSTIIGESIARLLEYVGFDVLRLNHIGDWGTQFGMLIAHLQDTFPDYGTKTPPIGDLQEFYKASKVRFDNEPEFKERAYKCVVKLQNRDSEITQAWQLICDVSRRDFTQLYKRLDVTLEERGESFYQERMVEIVDLLKEKDLLTNTDGRQVFWPTNANIPLILVKSDGGFTYDTSDLATIRNRLFEEKGEWLLYVVDSGQSEHFETIYSAAQDLGWYKPEETRVEHVKFGLVLGEDKKKFKTRSGDTVRLTDLLKEGVQRAENKLKEKKRDDVMSEEQLAKAKEALAYGCIKFADLSQARTSDYVFSFDQMLSDQGKTAVYLLYAYARIKSIGRTAQVEREKIAEYVDSLPDLTLPFTHDNEVKLAKQLLRFSDVVLLVLETLHLHKLCDYLYSLATIFHDFYKVCYVIEKDKETGVSKVNYHRLVLCEVTGDIMKKCFELLGIRPLEIM